MSNSLAAPWTVSPLSVGFPRQEYWSGLPFSSPGDLPNLGIEPTSPSLASGSLPLSHWESQYNIRAYLKYCVLTEASCHAFLLAKCFYVVHTGVPEYQGFEMLSV